MYKHLLGTQSKNSWERVGVDRRAGVVFPLFSIYSRDSIGIGEFPDLKLAIDWCKKTNNSILQVLPLNDTGFLSSPFSAQTSIGLNSSHLSLSKLIGVEDTKKEEGYLRKKFPYRLKRVDYKIGREKIKILKKIFEEKLTLSNDFEEFNNKNSVWLDDFSLFQALKTHHKDKSWKKWPKGYRDKEPRFIDNFRKKNQNEILFWKWVQWQCYEQLRDVRGYADKNNILIKGDIPLFVSDDSVDCWMNRDYFLMDKVTGAPPDNFSLDGQMWGMPPYNWDKIIKDDFSFFQRRLAYAENFYHIFRIDHVVGLFRTWMIDSKIKIPKNGFYDIGDDKKQEERGRKILKNILKSKMLPCAEDLGIVPLSCRGALRELGIPGLDVGRNQKKYREIAVSTISTHDMDLFPSWLNRKKMLSQKSIKIGVKEVLSSQSIFSILLIFEWLFFSEIIDSNNTDKYRINIPGIISDKNWSTKMPFSMEELLSHPANRKIKNIIKRYNRSNFS